jgi:hypothetical protein
LKCNRFSFSIALPRTTRSANRHEQRPLLRRGF